MLRLSDLKLNEANPRVIKDDKFKKLVESIKSRMTSSKSWLNQSNHFHR